MLSVLAYLIAVPTSCMPFQDFTHCQATMAGLLALASALGVLWAYTFRLPTGFASPTLADWFASPVISATSEAVPLPVLGFRPQPCCGTWPLLSGLLGVAYPVVKLRR